MPEKRIGRYIVGYDAAKPVQYPPVFEGVIPEHILAAYNNAHAHDCDICDMQYEIRVFFTKWGGLDLQNLEQALSCGELEDKIFALYALGYLAPAAIEDKLSVFLFSEDVQEKWVSRIALGQAFLKTRKDEKSLDLLQELLLDAAQQDAQDANRDLEDIFEEENYSLQNWFMIRRSEIVQLFMQWNNPVVLPTLRQALLACQQLLIANPLVRSLYIKNFWISYRQPGLLSIYEKQLTNVINLLE